MSPADDRDAVLDPDTLAPLRATPPLMPLHRVAGGHAPRFRLDGSLVPWGLDRINEHRAQVQQAPIAA